MSEELRDEVEAINSIYGDGCLTPAADTEPSASGSTYILHLPRDDDGQEASSLRIRFPATYPASAPEALGTHHSSGGKRGAGTKDLALFRDVLDGVFTEGVVCLFDALEEFARNREEELVAPENEASVEREDADDEGSGSTRAKRGAVSDAEILAMDPPPPWTLSEVVVENRSTFVARVAPVSSPAQAKSYIAHLLASDKRVRGATHNITAWRIRGTSATQPASTLPSTGNPTMTAFQDCDDDGETAAGGRLLHLMQLMDVWEAMVVVTRWYGGVKLGPRRFAVINTVARDGFVRAGIVVEKEKEKKKGK